MSTYLSPGVYVEEIASGSAPIVGVGTSIAAFIGTIKANAWSSGDGTPTAGDGTPTAGDGTPTTGGATPTAGGATPTAATKAKAPAE